MNFVERIKSYFSRESFQQDSALSAYDSLSVVNEPVDVVIIPPPLPSSSQDTHTGSSITQIDTLPSLDKAVEWPSWLEDETLLRDEGVIFGLSSSSADEKIAIIRSYFNHQTAGLEREIEQQSEKIQELNLFMEQKETRINELKDKLIQLEKPAPQEAHQLPRTLVGLGLSGAMCVGNYFLIEATLRPLYPNSPWIAVGVFLAGMFNLFGRVSLFHDTDSRLTWRQMLEEIGMPFAAALFVFVQALQNQSIERALALLVFVFFLFLFAGKLLLSNITVLRNDLKIWLEAISWRKEKKIKTENWEEEIVQCHKDIDQLRVQKWQILPALNKAEAEVARLHARRDALIKLFESEFNLARQLRSRLSDQQLREIQSEM
ncbi:MAG: hypothetical protein ACK4GN_09965 [Runella sp.]